MDNFVDICVDINDDSSCDVAKVQRPLPIGLLFNLLDATDDDDDDDHGNDDDDGAGDEDFDEDDEDDEDFDDGGNVDTAKVQMLLAIGHSFSLMPQSLLFNSSAMIVKMILVLICLLSFVFP